MSRCFPYPPPGFEKRNEPLIESIKKEKEKAKKEKKKEKRREKREKARDVAGRSDDKKHKNKKRHRDERSQLDQKVAEQLEKSSLSEEQGVPAAIYVCDSPGSSQNSSKRRKHNTPDVFNNMHGIGVRIKLPLKQREAEPTAPVGNLCLPSLKHKDTAGRILEEQPCYPLSKQKEVAPPIVAEQPCLLLSKQRKIAPPTPAAQPCFPLPQQKAIARPMPAAQPCDPLPKQKEIAPPIVAEQPCLPLSKQRKIAPPTPAAQPCFPLPQQKAIARPMPAAQPCDPLPKQKEIAQPMPAAQPCIQLPKPNEIVPSAPVEQPCCSGRIETTFAQEPSSLKGYAGSSKSRRIEAKFGELIINWKPQPLQLEPSVLDDQEWLTDSSLPHPDINMKCCRNDINRPDQGSLLSSWPPRACILLEAEVHALPFVLPF